MALRKSSIRSNADPPDVVSCQPHRFPSEVHKWGATRCSPELAACSLEWLSRAPHQRLVICAGQFSGRKSPSSWEGERLFFLDLQTFCGSINFRQLLLLEQECGILLRIEVVDLHIHLSLRLLCQACSRLVVKDSILAGSKFSHALRRAPQRQYLTPNRGLLELDIKLPQRTNGQKTWAPMQGIVSRRTNVRLEGATFGSNTAPHQAGTRAVVDQPVGRSPYRVAAMGMPPSVLRSVRSRAAGAVCQESGRCVTTRGDAKTVGSRVRVLHATTHHKDMAHISHVQIELNFATRAECRRKWREEPTAPSAASYKHD